MNQVRPALQAASAAAVVALTASAFAGSVRGRINGQEKLVSDVYNEAAKFDGHHFTWREPSPTVKSDFRTLSANPSRDICVAAESTGGPQGQHDPILVKITGGHTIPTTIVVSPNTRISFENRDPFPHRLYQVGAATWKAETMESARRREWAAPNGQSRFEFRDELFPSIRTYVLVDPQVVEIAYPGHDGAFLMNLPAGDFVLKAYFNGRQVGRPVDVTARDHGIFELKDPLNVGETPDGKPVQ